jgi:protein SCO1/2
MTIDLPHATPGLRLALVASLCAFLLSSCSRPKPEVRKATDAKRYHLTGRVISIDQQANSVMIDGDEIPNFMSAMQMPYTVKDAAVLNQLRPGDQISADVVVANDESWLENVTVTGHQPLPKPSAARHIPAPGEEVPDFQFTDQSGRRISLRQYRGQVLLLTFVYTRCPFPDYCPRISSQFAQINRQLQTNPALYRKTHLLSISFDPAHDTPKVLRDYGFSCSGIRQASLFEHWGFAVPRAAQLAKIANYFALTYVPDGGVITHSLSTAVIGPEGRIYKWYHDSEWQPAELIEDARDALHVAG